MQRTKMQRTKIQRTKLNVVFGSIVIGSILLLTVANLIAQEAEGSNGQKTKQSSLEKPRARTSQVAQPKIVIDIWCDFPVRELLRNPKQIPRLWSWVRKSQTRIFKPDSETLDQLWKHSLDSKFKTSEEWVLSSWSLLPPALKEKEGHSLERLHIANGFLLKGLSLFAERLGQPLPIKSARGQRSWLRTQLKLADRKQLGEIGSKLLDEQEQGMLQNQNSPLEKSQALPIAMERLRAGWFLLSQHSDRFEFFRPATRALLLSHAKLLHARSQGRGVSLRTSVSLATGPEAPADSSAKQTGVLAGGHWHEFMATLEILSLQHQGARFELWFFGHYKKLGAGRCQAFCLEWGPKFKVAKAQYMESGVHSHHPYLRRYYEQMDKDELYRKAAEQKQQRESQEGKKQGAAK